MQSFPAPAKVNLFLHITGQRDDGYHMLQSVFQLLDFNDEISIETNKSNQIKRLNAVAGVQESEDLCIRAALALQKATGCSSGANISVNKRIPMGGGLGGGSSDAATVLIALNHLWGMHIPRQELMEIGLSLGADVPVFIFGQNAWAEGIGEILTPINLATRFYIVLTPDVHVSTAKIFAHSGLTKDTKPLKIADFSNGANSKLFRNDLEKIVCKEFPAVATALDWLNQFGEARMSGSGASVFLAVNSEAEANAIYAQKPANINGFVAKSLDKHPLYELTQ